MFRALITLALAILAGCFDDTGDVDAGTRPGVGDDDDDEVCNGIDDNCDGIIDDNCDNDIDLDVDADSDGYYSFEDCDDDNPRINPGAEEDCRHPGDEDCDGRVDENCDDGDDTGGDTEVDEDGDGYPEDEDCDDNDASVNPDAEELSDGLDNDCDGNVDEGFACGYLEDQVTATYWLPGGATLDLMQVEVNSGELTSGHSKGTQRGYLATDGNTVTSATGIFNGASNQVTVDTATGEVKLTSDACVKNAGTETVTFAAQFVEADGDTWWSCVGGAMYGSYSETRDGYSVSTSSWTNPSGGCEWMD